MSNRVKSALVVPLLVVVFDGIIVDVVVVVVYRNSYVAFNVVIIADLVAVGILVLLTLNPQRIYPES